MINDNGLMGEWGGSKIKGAYFDDTTSRKISGQ